MKKILKKYFIPHQGNNHKPHFLREKSVATTALVAVILFFASVLGNHIIMRSPQLASIKSAFLVDLTNKDRLKEGLPELSINESLVTAANMKAQDMAKKEYFAHQSPDGRMPWDFIKAAGYSYVYAGENLAVNFDDSGEVERAWMDSPTHKKNIINPKYTEIGIATAPGRYKGDNTMYVVQMFGRPRSAAAAPVAVAAPVPEPIQIAQNMDNSIEPDNVLGEETDSQAGADPVSNESAAVSQNVPSSVEDQPLMEFTEADTTPAELIQVGSAPRQTQNVPEYTTWFERLIVSPSAVVQDLYMVLFAIVIFSLILKIFVEIRLQHPKNIAYGLILLLIIFGFMRLNQSLSKTSVVAMQEINQ